MPAYNYQSSQPANFLSNLGLPAIAPSLLGISLRLSQVDDALLPRGVPNFVVEGVLGDLQAAASRNLR